MKDESIDKLMNIMKRKYLCAELLAPLVGLSGVTLTVIIHSSWFSFQNNAISDLGRLGLEKNYILNMSLILAGFLSVFFAYGLLKESGSVLKKLGTCVLAAGLVSLILIGVFPEGTPPHNNVSLGFFLLTGFGILIIGIDALVCLKGSVRCEFLGRNVNERSPV